MITERKRSWEIYGFDIMIDKNYHPWLIEVNSSPACDYSTAVTECFVKKALPDTLKVILDNGQEDNGGWECIYSGKYIPKVAVGFGADMPLKGEKLSMKRDKKKLTRDNHRQRSNRMEDDLVFDDSDLSDYEQNKKKPQEKKSTFPHRLCNQELNKENYPRKNGAANKVFESKIQKKKMKSDTKKEVVPLNNISLDL